MYSRVAGTGSYLPAKVLSNADLEKLVETSDVWIRDRTGIERRHIAADGETTVDLAEHAARAAITASGWAPSDVDFIAFGTTTPDLVFPNCGVLLQRRLGGAGYPAFSVEAAYHYLGEVQVEGLPVVTHERSHAVSGSLVYMTPPLPQFLGTNFASWHLMARAGLAYKRITQTSALEAVNEGILSGVIGAGAEFRITPQVFTRLEYEFISTAIGGPTQSAPALNSSFKANFGGTNRVINVMHTPLALTVGVYF